MTLQQLAYFLSAAAYGSFSAAADALHLAQPSLSDQIRRLEEELGVPLFVRTSQGLVLTQAGEALRPHAEQVAGAVDQARGAVIEQRELRTGVASLGMFGLPPRKVVTDVVSSFRARHPGMRVRLVGQNSLEVADAVREGTLEAGIVALPVDDSGLDVRPVMADEVVYLSTDPARLRRRPTIERIAAAPLILFDARYGSLDPARRVLNDRAQRAGVRIEPVVEVEDMYTAFQLAGAGLGDTIAARKHVFSPGFPRDLGAVPLAEAMVEEYAVITRRGAHLSPATRELLALTEDRLVAIHQGLGDQALPTAD